MFPFPSPLLLGSASPPTTPGINTAYRYVGVRALSSLNNFIGCAQLSLFETGSATDRALSGTAGTVYTANPTTPVSNVNDGSDISFTTSNAAACGANGILYIDFGPGNAYSIGKVGWRARPATFQGEAPLTWEMVGKQNFGDAWTTICRLPDQTTAWGDNEYREISFTELSYVTPVSVSTLASYSFSPTYSGPASPVYSVFSGSLPPGLSLNSSTGVISGTASSAGTYSGIVVRATASGVTTDSPSFTITVVDGFSYYLLEVVTTGNTFIGCSTLKLLDSGATDWALQSNSGVATAVNYTVNGSFPVTNVNDGNDTSFTTSNTGSAGSGHGIQIAIPSPKRIAKVGFRSRSDSFGANEAITSGFVKGKLNASDPWTTLYTVSEAGWTNNEYREWTMP